MSAHDPKHVEVEGAVRAALVQAGCDRHASDGESPETVRSAADRLCKRHDAADFGAELRSATALSAGLPLRADIRHATTCAGGNGVPHDVFISYSSKNKKVADAVCARLETAGIRCWIAPRDIPPGTEWGESIIDGIRGSRLLVLIFSEDANASPQVRREVERAAGNNLPILPFRIEDVELAKSLEYFISNQHWLDAMTPPLAGHIDRLTEAVQRQLGREAPAPPGARSTTTGIPNKRSVRFKVSIFALIALVGAAIAAMLLWRPATRVASDAANPEVIAVANESNAAPPSAPGAELVGTWSGVVLVLRLF